MRLLCGLVLVAGVAEALKAGVEQSWNELVLSVNLNESTLHSDQTVLRNVSLWMFIEQGADAPTSAFGGFAAGAEKFPMTAPGSWSFAIHASIGRFDRLTGHGSPLVVEGFKKVHNEWRTMWADGVLVPASSPHAAQNTTRLRFAFPLPCRAPSLAREARAQPSKNDCANQSDPRQSQRRGGGEGPRRVRERSGERTLEQADVFVVVVTENGSSSSRSVLSLSRELFCTPSAPRIQRVAATSRNRCFLLESGEVSCIGSGRNGLLGYGTPDASLIVNDVSELSRTIPFEEEVVDIIGLQSNLCALFAEGSLTCWGQGSSALGTGKYESVGDDEVPHERANVPGVIVQVSAGFFHVCALLEDRTSLYCWGDNAANGQLGYGSRLQGSIDNPAAAGPVPLGSGLRVRSVETGSAFTCAVFEGSTGVKCWGSNTYGTLGYGHTNSIGRLDTPADHGFSALGGTVQNLSAGFLHACAMFTNQSILCWGFGSEGQLGYKTTSSVGDDELPLSMGVVSIGGLAEQLATGYDTTCVVLVGGSVRCWGSSLYGAVGQGSLFFVGDDEVPSDVPPLRFASPAVRLFAAIDSMCAILNDGQPYCWGRGDFAELGVGLVERVGDDELAEDALLIAHASRRGAFIAGSIDLSKTERVKKVSCGELHTCAILGYGIVRCWGNSDFGEAGLQSMFDVGVGEPISKYPDPIISATAVDIAAGDSFSCILDPMGRIRCWGEGRYGQLGVGYPAILGDDDPPSHAKFVIFSRPAIQVVTGAFHACALLFGGEVRCWGNSELGQLGLARTSPVFEDPASVPAVQLGQSAIQLSSKYAHTCVVLVSKSVMCWGFNDAGHLGLGHTDVVGDDEHPVSEGVVSVGSAVDSITAAVHHTCALKPGGRARCWGSSWFGALGIGLLQSNVGDDELPSESIDVRLDERIVQIDGGGGFTCALLEGGNVRCWGSFLNGRLGLKDATSHQSDPSLLPSLRLGGAVISISCGMYHSCAILDRGSVRCWGFNGEGQLGNGLDETVGDNEHPEEAPTTIIRKSRPSIPSRALVAVLPPVWDWNVDSIAWETTPLRMLPSPSSFPIFVEPSASIRLPAVVMREDLCAGRMEPFGSFVVCTYSSNDSWAYENPFVTAAAAFPQLVDTAGGTPLVILGNLGWAAMLEVPTVLVDSQPCANVRLLNFTALSCVAPPTTGRNLSVSLEFESPYLPEHVLVPSFVSSFPPRIDFIVPDTDVSASGQAAIRVQGKYFGRPDLVRVTISGIPCSPVSVESDGQLTCFPPATYLTEALVVVESNGQSSEPFSIFFKQPEIRFVIEPNAFLPSDGNHSFVSVHLAGRGFDGVLAGMPVLLVVGGARCTAFTVLGSNEIECSLTPPPRWQSNTVWLQIGDSEPASLELPSFQPPPEVTAISAASFPTSGGPLVRISGDGFGTSPSDVEWVRIGGAYAPVHNVSRFEIIASLPPGVGAHQPVVVRTGFGLESKPIALSYDAPFVETIFPAYALAGEANVTFRVCGKNLGRSQDDVDFVAVGGHNLTVEHVVPPCLYARTDLCPLEWPQPISALVSIGGQLSSDRPGLFEGLAPPTVVSMAVPERPTVGGLNASLLGTNFGLQRDDIASVMIGDSTVPPFHIQFRSRLQLDVILPPGVGTRGVISVTSRSGLRSQALRFAYDAPRIQGIVPVVGFVGSNPQTFVIIGTNFGRAASDMEPVLIGGVRCPIVRLLNASAIQCAGLVVADDDWPLPNSVEVTVADQTTGPVVGLFTGLGRPRVTGVSPAEIRPGSRISIAGFNFGVSSNDVAAVMVGGEPCSDVDWEPVRIRCTVSPTHWMFDPSRRPMNVSETSDRIPVEVRMRSGARSMESSKVNPDGSSDPVRVIPTTWVAGKAPTIVARDIRARREAGASSTVAVQWVIPSTDELKLGSESERVLSFQVHARTLDGSRSFRSVHPLSDVVSTSFSTEVVVSTRFPVVVSVVAENAFGQGPESDSTDPVLETCTANAFRASFRPVEERVCEDCPREAACMGLEAENVTARAGFWRVPWSENRLGFASCKQPSACEGFEGEDAFASNASIALGPSLFERCAEGREGVLCDSCAATFFKSADGSCVSCGSDAMTVLRIIGLLVLFAVLLGVLLIRAYGSAGESSSGIVRTLKIVFNHFQTIAIITAIRFEWPSFLQSVFTVSTATSSFTVEGVSLECALGSTARAPLERSLVFLSLPFWMLVYASLFWWVEASIDWSSALDRVPVAMGRSSRTLVQRHSPLGVRRHTMRANHETGSAWGRWLRRMKVSVPVLIFLVHTSVSKTAFQMITCESIAPDDEPSNSQLRLSIDLDTRCDDPANVRWMVGVSAPVLLLFSLGVPIATVGLLHKFRPRLLEPEMRRLFGFLFFGFRPGFEGWEGVNALRKVLLAGATVVLGPSGAFIQVGAALIVVTAMGMLHMWTKPYIEERFNRLEGVSLLVATLTLIMGLFIHELQGNDVAIILCGVVILGSNAVVLAMAAWVMINVRQHDNGQPRPLPRPLLPAHSDDGLKAGISSTERTIPSQSITTSPSLAVKPAEPTGSTNPVFTRRPTLKLDGHRDHGAVLGSPRKSIMVRDGSRVRVRQEK